jgi:hypothetical protein
MLRRVDLARTDVSEQCIASIIRVTNIGELGTEIAVTSKLSNWDETLCHAQHVDDGGDTLLRNVRCYKSHTESHFRIRRSSVTAV